MRSCRRRIITTLERCRVRPYHIVKKVVGSPYFRLRVGDYRVIMRIENEQLRILVVEIGKRENIVEHISD